MTGLLLLALAAAPESPHGGEVAVLIVRRTSVTPDEARAFVDAAVSALKAAGVAVEEPAESARRLAVLGVNDPTVCSGRKACVLELARQLEVGGIVSISAAALQQDRSIVFEAIRVADGSPLATDAAVVKAGAPVQPQMLAAVSRALAAAFPAKAQPKKDAPIAEVKPPPPTRVEPVAPPAGPVGVDSPPPPPLPERQRSHTAAFVTGGAAAVVAIAAIVLGAVALSARSQLTATTTVNGEMVSSLPTSRAIQLADQANSFGLFAGVATGVAVGLGVVAVVTW